MRLRVTRRWPCLFVFLYAVAGLAVSLATAPLGDLGVEADFFAELAPAAQELAAGHFAVANFPFKGPLHALVLVPARAALAPLGLDWYRSAVVVSLLAAAGTLLMVYHLAGRLAGARAAAVAMLVTGTVKVFFIHAHKASSDQLFLLLVVAAASLLLTRPPRPVVWCGAGVLAGLAWLTRDSGVVVLVWALAVLLLVDPDHLPPRRRLLAAGCLAGGFLLVAGPWLAISRAQTGRWLASHNLQNIVDEFYGGDRAALVPPGGFASLGQIVGHDPGWFAAHYLGNLPRHLYADLDQVTGLTFGAVAVLALLLVAWRRPDRRQAAFLLLGALMFLSLGAVFHRPRFSLVLVPVWALVVALGLERLPRWRTPGALAVLALAVFLHAGHIAQAIGFYDRQQPRHLLPAIAAAPRWSAAAADPAGKPAVLMARKAHLAHYAGLRYAPYPRMARDAQDLVDVARARGAAFLAVGSIEREYLPDPGMLDHLDALPGVAVVWRDTATLIYRLTPAPGGS